MATLAQVRDRVRRALEDTNAAAYLWSDAELADYLQEGWREFGGLWPRQWVQTLAAVANQTVYALDAECRQVIAVKVNGQGVGRGEVAGILEQGYGQRWAWQQPNLLLGNAVTAGQSIAVNETGLYVYPASDATASGLPGEGEDLVVWSAAWRAVQRRATASYKRGRADMIGDSVRLQYEHARRLVKRPLSRVMG